MADSAEHSEESAALGNPMPDHLAYRFCRENITSLLRERPETADLVVPACPDWTVRDLIVHLMQICGSNMTALGDPPARSWPAEPGLLDLLDEWDRMGTRAEELVAKSTQWHGPLILDVFSHELDLRAAIDAPVPADHPACPNALHIAVGGLSMSVQARGLPVVRFETAGAQWLTGAGEPAATVRAHPYDLYRSATGRRSHTQIAELAWSTAPEPWLPAFTWGPFDPPAQPAEELVGALR